MMKIPTMQIGHTAPIITTLHLEFIIAMVHGVHEIEMMARYIPVMFTLI